MDTVVYPDPALGEVLKQFVCIRVGFDRNKDLAKQYGVQPLTDIRILGPDGKQIQKIVGFMSAVRLAKRCQATLDLLAGKAPSGDEDTVPIGPEAGKAVDVTPEARKKAIEKGVAFLKSEWKKGWPSDPRFGPDSLVLVTWAATGPAAWGEELAKLGKAVKETTPTGTYPAALRALALARVDREGGRDAIHKCAEFLVKTQLPDGRWSYGPGTDGKLPTTGDNSNTAYAMLGLAACRKAGVEVPQAVFDRAEAAWRACQNHDGGWGYRTDRETESYASMTESGIACLALCDRLAGRDPAKDATIQKAARWLRAQSPIWINQGSAYQQGRLLYHLYALERAAAFLGGDELGIKDWERDSERFLLGAQKEDGSWDDGSDTPIPNTCFAILFLTRATQFLK